MLKEDKSKIKLIYKINNKDEEFEEGEQNINIFGAEFVKNIKNICKMIIYNKEHEISEKYKVTNFNNNILEIKLKGIENVTNMSDMFYGCSSLSSLPDISKWNTINVTDMRFMFGECSSLLSLPDISNWNTNKVTKMSYMFYGCSSLSSLPDISK